MLIMQVYWKPADILQLNQRQIASQLSFVSGLSVSCLTMEKYQPRGSSNGNVRKGSFVEIQRKIYRPISYSSLQNGRPALVFHFAMETSSVIFICQ